MAKKEAVEKPENAPSAAATAVINAAIKKHVKIWKLHEQGLSNADVATFLATNPGHVYNVIKDYNLNPEKIKKATEVVA